MLWSGLQALTSAGLSCQVLGLMWLVVEDHDNLFIMAEITHFVGIGILAFKLTSKKNAGGRLSLQPFGGLQNSRRNSAACENMPGCWFPEFAVPPLQNHQDVDGQYYGTGYSAGPLLSTLRGSEVSDSIYKPLTANLMPYMQVVGSHSKIEDWQFLVPHTVIALCPYTECPVPCTQIAICPVHRTSCAPCVCAKTLRCYHYDSALPWTLKPSTCVCSGLSLRSQELTAIFLAIRLYCRCMLNCA